MESAREELALFWTEAVSETTREVGVGAVISWARSGL